MSRLAHLSASARFWAAHGVGMQYEPINDITKLIQKELDRTCPLAGETTVEARYWENLIDTRAFYDFWAIKPGQDWISLSIWGLQGPTSTQTAWWRRRGPCLPDTSSQS